MVSLAAFPPTRGNPGSDSFAEPNLGPLTQHAVQPTCWHWVVVRKDAVFIARRHKARRMGSSSSKAPGVRERVVGFVVSSRAALWLVGGEGTAWCFWNFNHQLYGFIHSRVCVLVSNMWLTSSAWWGFEYLQNSSRMWLRIASIALEEELKVLDFVLQQNYYYSVWLDCFPLVLYLSIR